MVVRKFIVPQENLKVMEENNVTIEMLQEYLDSL